jgi:ABC-type transport system involved in multi-copper enzyme maturation permease subunit
VNPIISRELLEVLRTRKALAAQVGLALLCALLVLVRWPTGEVADLTGARSLEVMRIFGYGLLAGILLVVPGVPATSLVREKVQGTLALLLNSPLSPLSIYLGKLGGILGYSAVLLAMTLPAAAACYALGGTSAQGGIQALYGVLVLAALQMSTLGLLVSSRARSSDGALRFTYAVVLALAVVTPVPYLLLRGMGWPLEDLALWFRALSPVPAVMHVLGQGDLGTQGMGGGTGVVMRYAVVALLFSLACAVATITRLNHKLLDRARAAGVMTQDRSQNVRIWRRIFFLVDPQRRSGSMTLWINPVLVKEFRSRRFGRSDWTLRMIGISAILSLGLAVVATSDIAALGWGVEYIGGGLVLLQVALVILFAPSLAAGLISSERESGSWQLLRMTPLSAGAILRGKLLSVGWPLLLLMCATLPGYIVLMTIKYYGVDVPDSILEWPGYVGGMLRKATEIYQIQRVVISLCLMAVFAVLLSAAVSSLFRSTAAATTASYLLLLAVCAVPFLVWLGREAPFGHATVQAVLSIDPVAAALQAAEMPGFTIYELLPLNWWIIGSACVALLVLLCVRVWQLCRPS